MKKENFNCVSRLLDKVSNSDDSFAVFIAGGKIRITNTKSELFKSASENSKSRLLGVYDKNCKHEWILDDVLYAEKIGLI